MKICSQCNLSFSRKEYYATGCACHQCRQQGGQVGHFACSLCRHSCNDCRAVWTGYCSTMQTWCAVFKKMTKVK